MNKRLVALMTFILILVPFSATAQEGKGCYISPEAPMTVEVPAGQVARVMCHNGEYRVSFHPLDVSALPSNNDPGWVSEQISSTNLQATGTVCRGRSELLDNSQLDIAMTWYQVSMLSWHNGSAVTSIGGVWGDYYYNSGTGWYYNYSNQFPYQLSGTSSQAEGWGNFGHSLYGNHEHHMTITFTPPSGCSVWSQHWGGHPNWAYWNIYSYIGY